MGQALAMRGTFPPSACGVWHYQEQPLPSLCFLYMRELAVEPGNSNEARLGASGHLYQLSVINMHPNLANTYTKLQQQQQINLVNEL